MLNCHDGRELCRRRIPAGSHILSHAALRVIARYFAGRDSARLGEELIWLVLHPGMLGAESGRIIPQEILAELGEGDPIAGRKVLQKFLAKIRKSEYSRGGAVHSDDVPNLQELRKRMPANRLRRLFRRRREY